MPAGLGADGYTAAGAGRDRGGAADSVAVSGGAGGDGHAVRRRRPSPGSPGRRSVRVRVERRLNPSQKTAGRRGQLRQYKKGDRGNETTQRIFPGEPVLAIHQDRRGTVWFGTNQRLYWLEGGRKLAA